MHRYDFARLRDQLRRRTLDDNAACDLLLIVDEAERQQELWSGANERSLDALKQRNLDEHNGRRLPLGGSQLLQQLIDRGETRPDHRDPDEVR